MDDLQNRPHPSSVNSIPIFRLGDNSRQWVAQIERCGRMYGWSEGNKLDVAACRLGDEATSWQAGIEATIHDWDSFKRAFLERFDLTKEELYGRLTRCRQERGETVRDYADRYRDLAAQLEVDIDDDPIHLYNVLQGLSVRIHSKVFLMRPHTLEEAIYVSEGMARHVLKEEDFLKTISRNKARDFSQNQN